VEDFRLDKMLHELQTRMGDKLECQQDEFFTKINIDKADLKALMSELKEKYGFNYLANLTAVDFGEEFEVVYHLYSIPDNDRKICVKIRTARNAAEVDSLVDIWPTADWQEREVYDLMGIKFKGHPNLIRVLLPDDFEGHPLCKDFVMGG